MCDGIAEHRAALLVLLLGGLLVFVGCSDAAPEPPESEPSAVDIAQLEEPPSEPFDEPAWSDEPGIEPDEPEPSTPMEPPAPPGGPDDDSEAPAEPEVLIPPAPKPPVTRNGGWDLRVKFANESTKERARSAIAVVEDKDSGEELAREGLSAETFEKMISGLETGLSAKITVTAFRSPDASGHPLASASIEETVPTHVVTQEIVLADVPQPSVVLEFLPYLAIVAAVLILLLLLARVQGSRRWLVRLDQTCRRDWESIGIELRRRSATIAHLMRLARDADSPSRYAALAAEITKPEERFAQTQEKYNRSVEAYNAYLLSGGWFSRRLFAGWGYVRREFFQVEFSEEAYRELQTVDEGVLKAARMSATPAQALPVQPSSGDGKDVEDSLRELAELREKNLIDDEAYQRRVDALLSRI